MSGGIKMLDIGIIGAGPAGLSAGISGVLRNKEVKVLGRNPKTSWLYKAENVNNYLGLPSITGPDMVEQFLNHAREVGLEMEEGRVLQIFPMGEHFAINVENNFVEAKAIVIATGMARVKYLKGEKDYVGKGISYCATCDGPLYRDKEVVVYGETEEAEEDVNYLQEICKKVYYVPKYKKYRNVSDQVKIVEGKPVAVKGEDFVESLLLNTGEEIKGNCIFMIRESTPVDQLITGLELEDKSIKVNRFMETNLPGIYAAGDCTGKPHQISKAVGEGLVAAQQAVKYLHDLEG